MHDYIKGEPELTYDGSCRVAEEKAKSLLTDKTNAQKEEDEAKKKTKQRRQTPKRN